MTFHDTEKPSGEDRDFTSLDKAAKANLDVVFHMMPSNVINKPNINNVYFRPSEAATSTVPSDLQLEWLLRNYNSLARTHFDTTATDDRQLVRAIWHYAIDEEHSFSRHYRLTRYNLIAMAYVWSLDFPPELCGVDGEVRKFLSAFIEAWFAQLQDVGDSVDQDEFINLWMESELDFFTIRDNKTKRGIEAAVEKLHKQPLPPSLKQVVDFEAKDIFYDKYGPSLILQYVLAMERLSKSIFTGRSSFKEAQDKFVAYEMAKRKQGGLENVYWNSDLDSSLLSAADPQFPHPDVIEKLRRPEAKRVPWMDVDSFFKILRSGFEEMKKEEELIFSMGRTSLLSASEALSQKQGNIL